MIIHLLSSFNLFSFTIDVFHPYAHVQLYGFKAEKSKIWADYNGYEKNMKQAIEMGIEKQQYSLVAELVYKLGDYYYENRSYKLSAKYFKISAENKMD